jgi:hypothetical protein
MALSLVQCSFCNSKDKLFILNRRLDAEVIKKGTKQTYTKVTAEEIKVEGSY